MAIVAILTTLGIGQELLDPIREGDDKELLQAIKLKEKMGELYDMNNDEAAKVVAAVAYGNAEDKGMSPDEAYKDYPQKLKQELIYSPEQLRTNQQVTKFSKIGSAILFAVTGGLTIYSIVRGKGVAVKVLAEARDLLARGGTASEIANVLNLGKAEALTKIGLPSVIAGITGAFAWLLSALPNDWNDVFHWGRQFAQQRNEDLKKLEPQVGTAWVTQFGKFTPEIIDNIFEVNMRAGAVGISNPIKQQSLLFSKESFVSLIDDVASEMNRQGIAPTPAELTKIISGYVILRDNRKPVATTFAPSASAPATPQKFLSAQELTRITKTKRQQPTMFLGTIFGGRVAPGNLFIRHVDDKITDDADLLLDAEENLRRWLMALPGKLTYEIQIKFNPFDENQVRKTGMWCVLGMYVNNNFNKRMFIDEILLGPIDPLQYYPEQDRTTQIQVQLPGIMKQNDLDLIKLPDGGLQAVDKRGNVLRTVFEAGDDATEVLKGATKTPEAPRLSPKQTRAIEAAQTTLEQIKVGVSELAGQEPRPPAPSSGNFYAVSTIAGQRTETGPFPTEEAAQTYIRTTAPQYENIGVRVVNSGTREGSLGVPAATRAEDIARISRERFSENTLKVGDRGRDVEILQAKLMRLAHEIGALDGVFGPRTDEHVRMFQRDQRLTGDGIVGPKTKAELTRLVF